MADTASTGEDMLQFDDWEKIKRAATLDAARKPSAKPVADFLFFDMTNQRGPQFKVPNFSTDRAIHEILRVAIFTRHSNCETLFPTTKIRGETHV